MAVLRAAARERDDEIVLALADVHETWSCDEPYQRHSWYDEDDDEPERDLTTLASCWTGAPPWLPRSIRQAWLPKSARPAFGTTRMCDDAERAVAAIRVRARGLQGQLRARLKVFGATAAPTRRERFAPKLLRRCSPEHRAGFAAVLRWQCEPSRFGSVLGRGRRDVGVPVADETQTGSGDASAPRRLDGEGGEAVGSGAGWG